MSQREQIERNVRRIQKAAAAYWASLAARYNAPVYLTGSTLHNPSPRDCDIRIPVPDHAFAARYDQPIVEFDKPKQASRNATTSYVKGVEWANAVPPQRWIDDIAKTGEALSLRLKLNVDLQVWPLSSWRDVTFIEPVLLAGPSPRWFVYNRHAPKSKGAR